MQPWERSCALFKFWQWVQGEDPVITVGNRRSAGRCHVTREICNVPKRWAYPLTLGNSFRPYHWNVVRTDASLSGWGGMFQSLMARVQWSMIEAKLPIHILNLRAWTETHCPAISAVYISGVDNWKTEYLSLHHVDQGEWTLHLDFFNVIFLIAPNWPKRTW